MDNLIEYKNGNYNVKILTDGTKIRFTQNNEFKPEHPESIDIKITNYCDLNCKYCHENSTINGTHADLHKLLDTIKELPAGVELAVGGGNALAHPDIVLFLEILRGRNLIANITVNQRHLKMYQQLLTHLLKNDLMKGLGISIQHNNNDFTYVKPLLKLTNNIVYHLIIGVNKIDSLQQLIQLDSKNCKILILGYKYFGRGLDYQPSDLQEWYIHLPKYLGRCTLAFDNLAIEQLNIKRLFTNQGWDKFYMGDDFKFTMYIDAVKQEFAPTSRSQYRTPFSNTTLIEYFKQNSPADGG